MPTTELLDKAFSIAETFKASSPLGVAGVKRLINVGADVPVDAANELNETLRRPLEATKDYLEDIEAHFEKRKPVFREE